MTLFDDLVQLVGRHLAFSFSFLMAVTRPPNFGGNKPKGIVKSEARSKNAKRIKKFPAIHVKINIAFKNIELRNENDRRQTLTTNRRSVATLAEDGTPKIGER